MEHSLTCGWTAPGVPPPHLWDPAMAAHPGRIPGGQTVDVSLIVTQTDVALMICSAAPVQDGTDHVRALSHDRLACGDIEHLPSKISP